MQTMNRREFLKCAGAVAGWLALPRFPGPYLHVPDEHRVAEASPASLGRIATWRQAVRSEPSHKSDWIAWKTRDEIIPLYTAVAGEAPWPGNPIWYQTDGGFIHSGYVQPVENAPSGEVITQVAAPGFWAQVCVPIAEARWKPGSYVRYKLYYGTVYRVAAAVADADGAWWYQLADGITYAPGPYVPTSSVRRIPPEELAPLSPGAPDKWIHIDVSAQTLTCLEGETAVFSTRISSGTASTPTPRGEHRVLYKRHTRRMVGGSGDGRYDLPGVAFPVYFTWSACAIHGTYWHNDFVRPHSHGCVNVTNQAAQWIFRWSDPIVPYDEYERKATPEETTRVVVV
ncbi:MAG: hypothetical protein DRI48_04205 [Chloroflexi bacterium]|nr:MAG: hypothetical protein DRI48_04205 [Chloroflexota bacterium]